MLELTCSTCKKSLPVSMFIKRADSTRGYTYYCKECKKIKRVRLRNGNLKVQLQYLIGTSRDSAGKRGINDYDIDADYLEGVFKKQGGLCAISGIELTLVSGQGCVATNVSIDRINNEIGYTKENVQLVCRSVNSLKMNMGHDEFVIFMDKLSRNWIEKRPE